MTSVKTISRGSDGGFWRNPKRRAQAFQITLGLALFLVVWVISANTAANLGKLNQQLSFGFLGRSAGFEISQTLIPYKSVSTYGRALVVGLANTVLVSVLGIVAATVLGFAVGIMGLSKNWIVSRVAAAYIEFFRNIPLLLQVFVWYSVVIVQTLPSPREAWTVFGYAYISNRGLMIPSLSGAPDKGAVIWLLAAIALAWVAILIISRLLHPEQGAKRKTGLRLSLLFLAFGALLVLVMGRPFELEAPTKTAFSFSGGITIIPELIALLFALSVYTATYIAEAVRAGVMAVNRGQVEAAAALGLGPLTTTRLIVVPQAMRIIIPPLSTTYLGLIKNSSLAVAIGYPDLVATGGTILNQTGKAIEIVTLWMVVYLSLSLATSLLMNWFNANSKLVER